MAPNDFAGLAEIQRLLAVSKRTAQKYVARPEFPRPLDRLASGPVWRRRDIEKWARATLPLRSGRPRKRSDDPSR